MYTRQKFRITCIQSWKTTYLVILVKETSLESSHHVVLQILQIIHVADVVIEELVRPLVGAELQGELSQRR